MCSKRIFYSTDIIFVILKNWRWQWNTIYPFIFYCFFMFLISFCLRPVVFSSFRTVRIQFENWQAWGPLLNCKLINVITWEEATITMLLESAFCHWFNRQIIHMMTCEGVLIVCSLGTSLVDVWNFYQSLDVRDILLSYLSSVFFYHTLSVYCRFKWFEIDYHTVRSFILLIG